MFEVWGRGLGVYQDHDVESRRKGSFLYNMLSSTMGGSQGRLSYDLI